MSSGPGSRRSTMRHIRTSFPVYMKEERTVVGGSDHQNSVIPVEAVQLVQAAVDVRKR